MNDIAPEILARLDALASRLGTTVEMLWPSLVALASAKGLCGVAACLFFTVMFATGAAILAAYGLRKLRSEPDSDAGWSLCMAAGLLTLGAVFSLVGFFVWLPDVVAPEAIAIQELLRYLR